MAQDPGLGCIELQCPDSYNLVTIKLERSNHRV
jgi:hypothetical protein